MLMARARKPLELPRRNHYSQTDPLPAAPGGVDRIRGSRYHIRGYGPRASRSSGPGEGPAGSRPMSNVNKGGDLLSENNAAFDLARANDRRVGA